jgi:hypothetical protein
LGGIKDRLGGGLLPQIRRHGDGRKGPKPVISDYIIQKVASSREVVVA